ncbi:hypothetical protein [Brevundimonas viscosa]|uniref:Uncharacterized protein n=1 Tax=Brevundimonas viscosa TaxID=871741 RepID=A0A1I6PR03_9CAUL|nr:hypothetical protein [Brevundimonas viscosa]SFS42550.1 hypothetical protein SAMN05192570_1193 [Brevundimonas viscosa]
MIPDEAMRWMLLEFSTFTRSEWFDFVSTLVGTIALCVALGIALVEHQRAVRADEKRLSDFRRSVRALVNDLDAVGQRISDRFDAGEDVSFAWEEWCHLASDVRRALEALLPSAPPLPSEIVAVSAMIRRLEQSERFRELAWNPQPRRDHARAVRDDLARQIDKIGR